MERRTRVIAHRGASGLRPEHGADAYRLAVEAGADAIEPDIVATKDGVLVLRHENEISGTTDVAEHPAFADRRTTKEIDGESVTGWFTEDFTWAELSQVRIRERLPELRPESAAHDGEGRIQRLGDLLDLLDGDAARTAAAEGTAPVGLVAEIKHATYFASIGLPLDELVAAELASRGWADDPRLTVESFEATVLGRLRERGVGGRHVYLLEKKGAPFDLVARDGSSAETYAAQLEPESLDGLAASGLSGISVPKKLLLNKDGSGDARLVDRAHAAGLEILTWTLRPENLFLAKAWRSGSDPAALGDWRQEFSRIVDTGVDGVFTDFPGMLGELLRDRVAVD
ncbi:glycerophosphodiester phosphodiesterase family protein [Frondihabitans cladoniiphilus]|uniref:glycerophosphodiester phosphodiesterase n=1 Tax=Frondihabitans cladoniiphilus TaxID=715785 RepID=A0ABP8VV66_9MICO